MHFITTFSLILLVTTQLQSAVPPALYQMAPRQVVMQDMMHDLEVACICCTKTILIGCSQLDKCCQETENTCCGEMNPCARLVERAALGVLCSSCCISLTRNCNNYPCQHYLRHTCPAITAAGQCACLAYCFCRMCINPGLGRRIKEACDRAADWLDDIPHHGD